MLNDRDDENYKQQHPEESEYHFTDEDINYDVEDEEAKSESRTVPPTKKNIVSKLTGSKRMLISLVVFLVLVFIVYKMVTPSSQAPSTNIMAESSVGQKVLAPQIPQQNQVTTPITSTVPATVTPVTTPPPAAANPANPNEQLAQALAAAEPQAPAQTQAEIAQQQPTTTVSPATQNTGVTQYPSIIPVQSTTPTAASTGSNMDARISAVSAENDRLMSQLQGQYAKQLNDFLSQSKATQEQIQTLTTRISSLENQLNQLVQALMQRAQTEAPVTSTHHPVTESPQPVYHQPVTVIKIPYSVQAIIPGRAWLKADNGETLTVAEGDVIKNVGRVTKIDPYDGIVEINTGTKSVALSYGSGG